MLLIDVLNSLKYSELSQLSIAGENQGTVSQVNYPAIATQINNGLVSLYTRFPLKEASTNINLVPGTYVYTVPNADCLKISRVYGASGYEFPLNDLSDELSILTPSLKVLTVPEGVVDGDVDLDEVLHTTYLRVVYRAKHSTIDTDKFAFMDAEDTTLELPDAFMDALVYYVGSKFTTPLDITDQFHAGNNYAAKYEAECKRLEMEDYTVIPKGKTSRFESHGWV